MAQNRDEFRISGEIFKALIETGIPANILGYHYLKKALMIAVKDSTAVFHPKENIYQPIADEFGVTVAGVQQAIRHAIKTGRERSQPETLQKYFICSSNPKQAPKSAEYIAQVSEKIRICAGSEANGE